MHIHVCLEGSFTQLSMGIAISASYATFMLKGMTGWTGAAHIFLGSKLLYGKMLL